MTSYEYADLFRNGELVQRVCLQTKLDTKKDGLARLRLLHHKVKMEAYANPHNTYYIELRLSTMYKRKLSEKSSNLA